MGMGSLDGYSADKLNSTDFKLIRMSVIGQTGKNF
jgi:hypothetical protein